MCILLECFSSYFYLSLFPFLFFLFLFFSSLSPLRVCDWRHDKKIYNLIFKKKKIIFGLKKSWRKWRLNRRQYPYNNINKYHHLDFKIIIIHTPSTFPDRKKFIIPKPTSIYCPSDSQNFFCCLNFWFNLRIRSLCISHHFEFFPLRPKKA